MLLFPTPINKTIPLIHRINTVQQFKSIINFIIKLQTKLTKTITFSSESVNFTKVD